MDTFVRVSHQDFMKEYNIYVEAKQQALKELYHEMGEKYKAYMKSILPTDNEVVIKSIKYRVKPTKYDIKLLVGLLFDNDVELMQDYFRWILYGSKPHWVSLKHLNVENWALRHGIIEEKGGKYYFTNPPKYYKSGTPMSTRAVRYSSQGIAKYIRIVQERILKELMSEMTSIMKEK